MAAFIPALVASGGPTLVGRSPTSVRWGHRAAHGHEGGLGKLYKRIDSYFVLPVVNIYLLV